MNPHQVPIENADVVAVEQENTFIELTAHLFEECDLGIFGFKRQGI